MQSTPYDGRLNQIDEFDQTDEVEVDEATENHAEIEWKKAEIEQTRAEMTDTLSAIKDRLQPQVLMDQAKEKVHDVTTEAVYRAREATIGRAQDAVENVWDSAREAGNSVADTIKDNPIPVALIGIGVAWLLADAVRSRRAPRYASDYYGTYDRDTERQYDRTYARGGYMGDTYTGDTYAEEPGIRERIGERISDVRENLRDTAGTVRERAGEMADTVRERTGEMVGGVRERVGDMTGRVRERTGEVAGRVRERTGEVTGRAAVQASLAKMESRDMMSSVSDCVHDTMQNNPMALGLVALGLGAAIGFLLPETRREHEMMGEARDRLADQAREVATEVKDKVQTVAQRVQGVATEALNEAKHTAKEAFNEAKQVATEEARNQGLTGKTADAGTPMAATTGTGTSTNWPSEGA